MLCNEHWWLQLAEISVDKECINAEKKTTEVACTINADVELPDGVSEQLVQEIDAILSDATKVVNIPAEVCTFIFFFYLYMHKYYLYFNIIGA